MGIFSTLCVNSVISDECKNSIDKFYSDISECIKIAVSEVIYYVSICLSVLSCVIYCYLSVVFMGHAA